MKKSLLLLTTVILILAVTACDIHAQFAQKGQTEIGGAVSYSSITAVANGTAASDATTILELAPTVSYFVSDNFSIGLVPSYASIKSGGTTTSLLGLFAAPGYTFGKGEVYPFVRGELGYTSQSSSASGSATLSGLSYGVTGGVKVLVGGKNGLLNIGLTYKMITLNPSGADKRNGFNYFGLTLGFSVFIGGR